jgi:transcription initiation factor TFIID subunit 15
MGDIPSQEKMVSTVILSPKPGENVPAKKPLTIQIHVANLEAGKFTQPYGTYYTAPQQVGPSGQVQGHVHVTVQNMGDSMTPTQPLDASKFVFFKGINDVGDGNGRLSTTIPDGLEKGYYRVCTMNSAQNHQPVLMPVAQRGAQDDCTKFSVGIEAKPFKTDLRVVSDQDTTEKMFHVSHIQGPNPSIIIACLTVAISAS